MFVDGLYVNETFVPKVSLYVNGKTVTPAVTAVHIPATGGIIAEPATQELQVGGLVAPLTHGDAVNVAETVQALVIAPVVYVLPDSDPPQPETVLME